MKPLMMSYQPLRYAELIVALRLVLFERYETDLRISLLPIHTRTIILSPNPCMDGPALHGVLDRV